MMKLTTWMAALGLALGSAAPPVAAQEVEDLVAEFQMVRRQVEIDVDAYVEARESARAALEELLQLDEELDREFSDPSVSLKALRKLERGVDAARSSAFEDSRREGELRRALYEGLERFDSLLIRIEDETVPLVAKGRGVTGTWRIEVPDYEVQGVMSLEQDGSRVTGNVLMSTGNRTAIEGSYVNGWLEIDWFTSGRQRRAISRSQVDEGSGVMSGIWRQFEVAIGEPAQVSWSAHRITLDGVVD